MVALAGSITSPMIYPTESSLLLRERKRDKEGKEGKRIEERKMFGERQLRVRWEGNRR